MDENKIDTERLSKQIFNIPYELYCKMLVEYTDIKENVRDKNINLNEYAYVNVDFPLSDLTKISAAIGYKEHIPNWTDVNRKRFVTKKIFVFWDRPQYGAENGYIHVFDSRPILEIYTQIIHDDFSRNQLQNVVYKMGDKKLNVCLGFKLEENSWLNQSGQSLKMITKVIKDFEEIKCLAENLKTG